MTRDEARKAMKAGATVTMTDLRTGSHFPVVIKREETDGRMVVRDLDSGYLYRVDAGFLSGTEPKP